MAVDLQPSLSVYNVDDAIREVLDNASDVDLDAIAAEVAEGVPEDALRRVVESLARSRIRHLIKETRRIVGPPAPGSRRWEAVKHHNESGALAIYRWQVNVGPGRYKLFGDLGLEEVQEVANAYKRRALEMADQAQRFRAVLAVMNELRVARVSEVPARRFVEIFNA